MRHGDQRDNGRILKVNHMVSVTQPLHRVQKMNANGRDDVRVEGVRQAEGMAMRFDIHKVRIYLVNELLAARTIARVDDDGTDIILADLVSGETVIIHLIERMLPVSEIVATLEENGAVGRHTLLILWSDMLLPEEGKPYLPDEWMELLYTLYADKIYGYDSYGPYASVFPVFFEQHTGTMLRNVHYGPPIDAARLRCDRVYVNNRFASGHWRVADFGEGMRPDTQSGAESGETRWHNALFTDRSSLAACYEILTVPLGADRQTIRRAYLRLARMHHPDTNASPEATARMQQINEAYRRIMQVLDHDQKSSRADSA